MSKLFKEKWIQTSVRRPVWTAWCAVVMSAGILFGAPGASAQIVAEGFGCMQEVADRKLGCTANDVQLANATNIVILDPEPDPGCAFLGDEVTFEATFEVILTAQARHDIGIFFATDGDDNGDGAKSGECTISTVPFEPDPPFLDLDGFSDDEINDPPSIQDLCGDIDANHNPLFPVITITTKCIDPDGDGKLNLPNCTSWRQPGANELCTSPTDAFPGSPSKCRCDNGFNVDIDVPAAKLLVTKTVSSPNPAEFEEPSGEVTFDVTVTNTGIDPSNKVVINSLLDSIYNDITTFAHDGIISTTCAVPQTICPDVPTAVCDTAGGEFSGTYSCAFTAIVEGDAGDVENNVVTANGVDDNGNLLDGKDDATVEIKDATPSISVIKLANGEETTTVPEPGDDVTFSVAVTNTSVSSDPVTITSLIDDIYSDLNGQGGCSVPQTIQPGDTYNCSFVAFVGDNYEDSETDTVTASGVDDDSSPVSNSDSATVMVTNIPSDIELEKTVVPLCDSEPTADPNGPGCVDEPGGQVTYTYKVTNTSTVDTVTINTLSDDVLGDLNGEGCSVPQVLAPGEFYECSVIADVSGEPSVPLTNTGTASGLDDDQMPVEAMDPATVNFNNVPPAASLTKEATMAVVTFLVTVTNDSDAEDLILSSLIDDKFGDVTQTNTFIVSTNCAVPQTLGPSGEPDDSYNCSFDAKVSCSSHTDTVTGTVNDDDDSNPVRPSGSATVTLSGAPACPEPE